MITVGFAVLDAAAGAHLVLYALRRERRDKDAVLAVGLFLLVCAVVLVLLELLPDARADVPAGPAVRS